MTKLNSKYLKDLIMEVMIGTGGKQYDVPVPSPMPNINGFDYGVDSIPQDLKDKIVANFKELLGKDPHLELAKIAADDDDLEWQDFYSILKDASNVLRPQALLTIRQSIEGEPNSKYSKAFDDILGSLRDDLQTAPVKNLMTPDTGDISDRKIKPPPSYIRNAFLALGLDKTSSLKERIKKITDFSLQVKNNTTPTSTISESVSSVLILNGLGNIVRTLSGVQAGYSFEDFLSLLSEGTVEGEKNGAADFMSGILIDENGTVSQYGSAKLYGSGTVSQARSTISQALPGGATPASLAVDFKGQVLDKIGTKTQAQAKAKADFQKKYGLDDDAMDKIKSIAINLDSLPDSELVYKPTRIPKADDVAFGNETMAYVVGYKRKGATVYKKGKKDGSAKAGDKKPGAFTSKSDLVEEIDIHVVVITRSTGAGTVMDNELSIDDGSISVEEEKVVIKDLTSKSIVGTLMINSSQAALEQTSTKALDLIDKNIPLLVETAKVFSETSMNSLITGKQDNLDDMADAYISLFSLINNMFNPGTRFEGETGSSVGIETSGDTIKKR